MSNALFARITKDNWEKHEEVVVNYADLKASIDDYYDENIAHRDQTDKLPSGSVTLILALTHIPANVEGENETNTATEEPPSHTEAPRIDKGKGIATESEEDSSKKIVPASTIVRPDPDEEIKVPYMINGKMYYLTDKEMQAHLDREEKLRKVVEEERLLSITKPEAIKVVQEEAEKIGLDPKKIASTKAGEKFKKARDAEHEVLKR
ncbi:hypothetical protein Tco_1184366 [Tanacetum coccineum]